MQYQCFNINKLYNKLTLVLFAGNFSVNKLMIDMNPYSLIQIFRGENTTGVSVYGIRSQLQQRYMYPAEHNYVWSQTYVSVITCSLIYGPIDTHKYIVYSYYMYISNGRYRNMN